MKKEYLKIAVSGFSGCGNTTVSNMLAEKLNIQCINYTFRNLAKDLNMDFKDIVEKSKKDFSFDKMVDTKQIELTKNTSCVLGSRLAIWLLKDANLKVFLTASPKIRAERIADRESSSIEEVMAFTKKRDEQDSARYMQLYKIDNTDYKFADLIIDTEKYLPEQICKIIIDVLKTKSLI
ncbi:MAG: cytidylate kinase family protein [Treponemataceae bacterium]